MRRMKKRKGYLAAGIIALVVLLVWHPWASGGSDTPKAVVAPTPSILTRSTIPAPRVPSTTASPSPTATNAPPSPSMNPMSTQTVKPSPSSSTSSPSAEVTFEPGERITIGALSITLPKGYERIDGELVDSVGSALYAGPDPEMMAGVHPVPAILRLDTSPGESLGVPDADDILSLLFNGQCIVGGGSPVVTERSAVMTLASGQMPAHVKRVTFRCPGETYTFSNWYADDGTFAVSYFGKYDRRPAELTTALKQAQFLPN